MAIGKYRVKFPPFKIIEEQSTTGGNIQEILFEDKNKIDELDTYTGYATVDPLLSVSGGSINFAFPHITNIKAIWWEFSDPQEALTSRVQMTLNYGGAGGSQILRGLEKRFFMFTDFSSNLTSIDLEVEAGDNIKLKMVVLG